MAWVISCVGGFCAAGSTSVVSGSCVVCLSMVSLVSRPSGRLELSLWFSRSFGCSVTVCSLT